MIDTRKLQERLGQQIERVISESPNPGGAMEEIAFEAEKRGLIDSGASLRRENPRMFVMDLWYENPVILDRLNLHRENLKRPAAIQDLSDVLGILP